MPTVSRIDRRTALTIGGAGFLGLSQRRLFAAEEGRAAALPARAKSVVFLYQFGGPSHVDTFDMKPDAPDGIRSKFSTIDTNLAGVPICEHLPGMATVMDKVCLVRSVNHTMKNHNSASYYALTGNAPPVDDIRLRDTLELYPAYGSLVDRFAPVDGDLPTFVSYPYVIRDGAITPGQHASFLGKRHDPMLVTEDPNAADFELPQLGLPANLDARRLADRRSLQRLVNDQLDLAERSATVRGVDAYYERALGMLQSEKVKSAFDIGSESDAVRERYGRTTYGQSCLLARRLVEAGVRFVNVYFSSSIGGQSKTSGGWDTHGFNDTRQYPILESWQLPLTNTVLPTFLNDLDDRGLLDETLVVWMGEFGRTPKINANISRDHWPQCYTALLAGGGVKRGFVYGGSDRHGAYPSRDPVSPDDLAATMFRLLGIDTQHELRDHLNRPLPLTRGRVLHGLLG